MAIGFDGIVVHAEDKWEYGYTGDIQEFEAPYTGKYYIEAYGASTYRGGRTVGHINLVQGQKLYIGVGEQGKLNGGATFGGGGAGGQGTVAGSGATFITRRNRGDLYKFSSYKSEVILVAGGSGGQASLLGINGKTGEGGGEDSSGMTHDSMWLFTAHDARGANQTTGYNFGKGQDYCTIEGTSGSHGCHGYGGAGGGGWYGGGQGKCGYISGGGGSGYVNRNIMYQDSSYTERSPYIGNGKVTISWEGEVYTDLTIDTKEHGTYQGQRGKIVINNKYGTTISVSDPVPDNGYKFLGWKTVYGSSISSSNEYTYNFKNSYIEAQWIAPLKVESEVDITDFNNRGGMNFRVTQLDELEKVMTIQQSIDGNNFYDVFQNEEGRAPESNIHRFYNRENQRNEVETFTAPSEGIYKLEVYGPGNCKHMRKDKNNVLDIQFAPGGGGSAQGYKALQKNSKLYIAVGGVGAYAIKGYPCSNLDNYKQYTNSNGTKVWEYKYKDCRGGWNGGGDGRKWIGDGVPDNNNDSQGGSGATHIATSLIGDGQLKNYSSNRSSVLLVAGGAGGYYNDNGQGGGTEGTLGQVKIGSNIVDDPYPKATQTSGYAFGQGQSGYDCLGTKKLRVAGGGGGWYGGYTYTNTTASTNGRVNGGGGSGHLGNVINGSMQIGVNHGEGYAVITLTQEYITGNLISHIFTPDKAAPNIPTNGAISSNNDKLTLKWDEPNDNGTKYWHKIESYLKDTSSSAGKGKLLNKTTVEDIVTTGVKGYHYYVDTNEAGVVSKSHSYVETASVEIERADVTRYMHVAAIDKAGNLGPTYTFEIPSVIYINYFPNDTELNVYNDISTTSVEGKINPDLVPSGQTWTCKNNITNTTLGDTAYTKTGYKFAGWNLLSTAKIGTGTTSDQNGKKYTGTFIPVGTQLTYDQLLSTYGYELNLYAIWEPIRYKIVYHGNGNWNDETVGTEKTSNHRYDHPQKLLKNVFTRNEGETWGSEVQPQEYEYLGWGTTSNQSTVDYNDEEEVINLTSTDNDTVNLYALWRKDLELIFKMQGGFYNNSEDDVVLKASVYNSQKTYTFNLLDGTTASNLPKWTKQQGTIDAYGDFLTNGNGINTKYVKTSEDGSRLLRFLGWNTDHSSKIPLPNMIVYDRTGHIVNYTTNHTETFYAVWEPILIVELQAKRVLGDLFKRDGTKPNGEAHGLTAVTPEQTIEAVITSGEQGYYRVIASGNGTYNITSTFDDKMTEIYKQGPSASWWDRLNEVTSENYEELQDKTTQKHSLNRYFTTHNNVETRKFYVPQYLGTAESYPNNSGVIEYNNEFIVSQPSYYWKYVHNKDEQIRVKFNIFITSGQGGPSDGGGGGEGGGTVDPTPDDSILRQFRTTILY